MTQHRTVTLPGAEALTGEDGRKRGVGGWEGGVVVSPNFAATITSSVCLHCWVCVCVFHRFYISKPGDSNEVRIVNELRCLNANLVTLAGHMINHETGRSPGSH